MTEQEEHVVLDLLAVIHRDGGQHTGKVGIEKACKDAMEKYYGLLTALERVELRLGPRTWRS